MADALDRESDLAARYGGEEFAALLPGTTEAGARTVAERIRAAVQAAAMPHEDSAFGHVTISLGVASMAPAKGDAPDALIALADGALYHAKQAGRNQVRGAAERLALGHWQMKPGHPGQAASASTS
jgi:diguanylate cyclase (GGDEF)-like protein